MYESILEQTVRFVQKLEKRATKMEDRSDSVPKYTLSSYIHCCHLYNNTTNKTIGYRTPDRKALGATPDISHLQFSWWKQVYYYEAHQKYSFNRIFLGRWSSDDTPTSDSMTFHIITLSQDGTRKSVISR